MSDTIQIAVVGHTNAGKTSLLRTLTRRGSFGEVSERPGTTRHVESVDLTLDGARAARFFDTPGLEDSVALLDYLQALEGATRPDRVRAFLKGPEASRAFEQEAKVLRQMLEVDAAFYVIDCREPVLPKFRAEMEILTSCGKPVMPVLNFVRHPRARDHDWEASLSDAGLHALARFDAVAPYIGSEQQLYRDLATLLRNRQAQLRAIIERLEAERMERRELAYRVIASLLIDIAAMRHTIAKADLAVPDQKRRFVDAFTQRVVTRMRAGVESLLEVYAFRKDEADVAVIPWLDGRWDDDLFNPEVLRDASLRLGTGAAIGASVGVVADLALAGLSLGTGAALGAAVGGALSQGAGHVGRTLANKIFARVDLSLEEEVVQLVVERMLGLLKALEERGHAAFEKLPVESAPAAAAADSARIRAVLHALMRARGHPEWALDASHRALGQPRRKRTVEEVVAALRAAYVGA
jgi:hypothetical protein